MERFLEENPESVKPPEKEISKAVFIMYPDMRTTRPKENIIVDGKSVSHFCQTVFERYEKILQAYKRNGFKIIGVVYNDTLPDKFSPLYPKKEFDELLPVSTDFKGWNHKKHGQWFQEAVKKINLSEKAKVIIGGYHAEDCVLAMGKVLKTKLLNVKINAELTEKQGEMFVMFKEMNKILSSGMGKDNNKEVREMIREEIDDNKDINRREIRRIASLLKNK